MLNNRERFRRALNFQQVDRLPMIEWATWWDKTLDRWRTEGLPPGLTGTGEIGEYLGLDAHRQYWLQAVAPECPRPAGYGMPLIRNEEDYLAIRPHLYPESVFDREVVRSWAQRQREGDLVVWITLEGFFWFPRVLLGIEPHLYAFYDQPDLLQQINEDLLEFNLRVLESFSDICTPDFMTFAEDLSYNHGPMLSRPQFNEFMAPYYERLVPELRQRGIVAFVDTDGDVCEPVRWLTDVGIKGFLPLERMAGVDVSALRKEHPRLRMIGAFDKTVMHLGEGRIRQEFERILPVMRQGGYIPSVDHQTPPGVSLAQYRTYVDLLREYCHAACE